MQSAPASFSRLTDQWSSKSPRRPGPVLSYPVFSYASSSPAFLARRLDAGSPHSGSSRMAVACGVRTSVTSVLNSSIMASVTSPPFSFAKDFCSEPRWSIAAAAMTPRSFETFLRPASLPGVSFMRNPPKVLRIDECVERIIVNDGHEKNASQRCGQAVPKNVSEGIYHRHDASFILAKRAE